MSTITTHTIDTDRLTTHYLASGPDDGTPVLLVHGNVSSSRFFAELLDDLPQRYRGLAPDLRGFGESQTLPVDATRGVRDWSDDLHSLVEALGLADQPLHLLGWSLGGGVAMQYAINHPNSIASLTLIAPVSPYGFGGTKGENGELVAPDAAGSGGGTANQEFVQRLRDNDTGSESNVSPRTVMNTFYVKPPFQVDGETEDAYVASMNSTVVGEENYPGDAQSSSTWPMVAPGTRGVLNAISPKYFDTSAFAKIEPRPAVLWIRGDSDQVVADSSIFDLAFLGQIGAVPDWPGADACPPQPMVGQTRAVLEAYRANGGRYEEVVLADCGHSPHIEKAAAFRRHFFDLLARSTGN